MNERAVGKLEDVVRALSLAAADYLYSELKKQGCLAATRLASSALRDLVDGSVEELRVTQAPLLNPVRVPSLARWPRCHTVIVQPRFGSEPVDAAVLLQAPFLGQLESSRRRITCVRLELDRYPRTRPGSGDSGRVESALAVSPTVCSLAGWLPCLRELDLGCLDAEEWTCGGRAAALMHAALASLGSVESLALPSVALLPGIEALAGSLRRLSVGSRLVKYREGLDEEPADEDIESVRQLLGLEELTLHQVNGEGCQSPDAGLLGLLNCLPPSVRRVKLDSCLWMPRFCEGDPEQAVGGLLYDITFNVTLEGGRAITYEEPRDKELFDHIVIMEELCMHWRALAGPLLRVKLGTQSLLGGSDSLEQLFGPDYAFKYGPDPLRAHRTLLSRCDQPEVAAVRVAQDAELDEVLYTIDVFSAAPELRLDTAVGDWALPLRPPSRQPAPLCTGPQLLSEESVLGLALQRIADAGPEVLPSQHQWPWEAGSTESTYSAWPPLLLLRGSVGMAAAASSACQGLKASGALKAVLPLPGDSAALLLCESRKGAAAVVAAAVAPLGAGSRFGPTPLRWALQQVVAKLWTDATDGGVGLAERVRWALGVRDHLGSLPKDLRQWPGALL